MTENAPTPGTRVVKPPPLLLGAALLFWGWKSDLLAAGAVMAVIIESPRLLKARWDLSDDDFRRILTFCTVLGFAVALYALTSNEVGGSFSGLFRGPAAVHNASLTGLRASIAFFRWLPMTLFLFAAAQAFSVREKIPLTAISIISRRRSRLEKQRSGTAPPVRSINVSYPYFFVCLFSAGIHSRADENDFSFYWGQCVLIIWALWQFRSGRFGIVLWAGVLAMVVAFGYGGQKGILGLAHYIETADSKLFARFMRPVTDPMQAVTSMGQIGEMKLSARIVVRLQTKAGEAPPTYLREASYRTYHSEKQRWYSGSPRTDFDPVTPEHDQTTWMLLPGKTNSSSVNIACYLDSTSRTTGNPTGLLPLPIGSGRLENFNAYLLNKNSEGAVLADGPGLVIFDARYGPGATIDAPPDTGTNLLDLAVPTNERPALDEVISQMDLSGKSEPEKLRAVYGFFQNHFTYSLWQGPDKQATTNETPLTKFLLTGRSGHCEYFATATVLLLRELKIPARYAAGFAVHEAAGSGYVVRERDAHAWCLVWNEQAKTWEDFDTTPASWIAEEGKRASAMQWLSDFWSWVGFQISKFRWGQTNLREYILWGLIPVLLLLLYQIIFRRGRRRQRKKAVGKNVAADFWPGLDSEFYLLEKQLAARGVARPPGELLSLWLARALEEPALADLRGPLRELLQLHYRHRFDPQGLSGPERETLTCEAKACLKKFSQMAGRG